jgi:hypothetical protein
VKNLGRVKAIEGVGICQNAAHAAHGYEMKEDETYCSQRREVGVSIFILRSVEFK